MESTKSSLVEGVTDWIATNQLKTVGVTWAAVVTGSLAYQWTRPIPMQLKIIHSRIYAQGFTVAALAAAGILQTWSVTSKRE